MSMYTTLYHPTLGERKFWTGDAVELLNHGWYASIDDFPPSPPEPISEAVEPVKRRGRKPHG